jgi:hypothetical protein
MKRIMAKGFFLTYPKCDITKEAALPMLRSIDNHEIIEYVIAEELHEDGTPHLHAFIRYDAKVEYKTTKWDIGEHHGNYQTAKSWNAVKTYCKKGGTFIANIDIESAIQKRGKKNAVLL